MPHEDRIDELNREINKLESLCNIKTEEIKRLHRVCKNKDEGLNVAIELIRKYVRPHLFYPERNIVEHNIEKVKKYLG